MSETNTPTIYQEIGGETVVRRLVDAFYDHMDSTPELSELRAMHPETLDGSRNKLFAFLSGWFGGPNLFVERYGQPFMRRRHSPFAIGSHERDQWLQCMAWAMEHVELSPELQLKLGASFFHLADFMRNKEG